jgi:hypothetical protein
VSEFLGVDPISLNTFCGALRATGEINVFCVHVDMSALPNVGTDGLKAATNILAEIVWETTGYRFLYVAIFWTLIFCNNHKRLVGRFAASHPLSQLTSR